MLIKAIVEYEKLENFEVIPTDVSFHRYLEEWVATTEVRETTRKNYRSYLNQHILPYFKKLNIKLQNVRPSTLRTYYDYCKNTKKLSAKTIRNQQGVLSKALHDAFYDDLIPTNPHTKVRFIRVEAPMIETLTEEEVDTRNREVEIRVGVGFVL